MKKLGWFLTYIICCFGAYLPIRLEAAEVREKAEAEGKAVFYASMTTSDVKALVDGFKQLYPKIDAQFYRTGDSQLMEKVMRSSWRR
ncbi:MAG: hypothetical protein HYY81_02125 [Deltaproteobacteria bacterium]|nr:hypothetical protein [Deltaproteobacteria bacterium]